MTLACMGRRTSARQPSDAGMSVACLENQGFELRIQGRAIPVKASVLRDAVASAGIRLEPGQTIVPDRDLSRRCIRETLVDLSLEEFRLREAKSMLLQALYRSGEGDDSV